MSQWLIFLAWGIIICTVSFWLMSTSIGKLKFNWSLVHLPSTQLRLHEVHNSTTPKIDLLTCGQGVIIQLSLSCIKKTSPPHPGFTPQLMMYLDCTRFDFLYSSVKINFAIKRTESSSWSSEAQSWTDGLIE